MFRVVLLLEGEPPPQSQAFCSLQQVFFQNIPGFSSIHLRPASLSLLKKSIPTARCCHQHGSLRGWCVQGDVQCCFFVTHSVIRPEHLPPCVCFVSYMAFSKLMVTLLITFTSYTQLESVYHY
ncbi:hypothetical protein ATANTOWER_010862 [Ataeniobius toweri]|uniref:Uncharacterized protein n=1 Tax=Ataeniobius toweri TaxID=208326 RepID=A0ABU7AL03_9TELE|nr:hypothetical protein [Ataeniobius toweri]